MLYKKKKFQWRQDNRDTTEKKCHHRHTIYKQNVIVEMLYRKHVIAETLYRENMSWQRRYIEKKCHSRDAI